MATPNMFGEFMRWGPAALFGQKAAGFIPTGVQGRPQYPSVDIASLMDTYAKNELVYAAINRKATAAVDVRLVVEERSSPKAEWEEVPGHPFRQLMMEPNPEMIETDFLRSMIVGMDVSGYFYGEKVYDGTPGKDGIPKEIHPLNPSFLAPIPRPDGKTDYQYKEGSHIEIIPAERMLVKRKYDPRNKLAGLSPLAVVMGTIDADNAQTDFIRAFFNNGGQPAGLLKVKGRINQDDADKLRMKWTTRFSRRQGRQHDILVLDDQAEYQKIGANLEELGSQDIRSFTESRIAMTFDVPPLIIYAYVGLLRATYSNLKEAWTGFWDASLKPMYKDWSDFLTWRLLSEFEGKDRIKAELVRLRWDFSGVSWLVEDVEKIQARAREGFAKGILTLNEARAVLGEQEDPAGNYYLRPFSLLAQVQGEPVASEPATGQAGTTTAGTGGGKNLAMKRRILQMKRGNGKQVIERRIEKAMSAVLLDHYRQIADAVEAAA